MSIAASKKSQHGKIFVDLSLECDQVIRIKGLVVYNKYHQKSCKMSKSGIANGWWWWSYAWFTCITDLSWQSITHKRITTSINHAKQPDVYKFSEYIDGLLYIHNKDIWFWSSSQPTKHDSRIWLILVKRACLHLLSPQIWFDKL